MRAFKFIIIFIIIVLRAKTLQEAEKRTDVTRAASAARLRFLCALGWRVTVLGLVLSAVSTFGVGFVSAAATLH